MTMRSVRWRWTRTLLLLAFLAGLPLTPTRASSDVPSQVYFDGTGQVVGKPFLDYWLAGGGIETFGEPISAPVMMDGRWVQWFKYARLDTATPTLGEATVDDVQVAPVGAALMQSLPFLRWHPAFAPIADPSSGEARYFPETAHSIANAFRGAWESNDTGERLGLPLSEELSIGDTVYQYFERGALSWNPNFGVSVVPVGVLDAAAQGQLRLTGSQPDGVPSYTQLRNLPVMAGSGERWIDVNLSTFTLTAYQGVTPVMSTSLVDGAPETPTVRGTFYIYWKLDLQTMRGPNADGTEYVTPDVPWVMYFYADFALHGAYWRDSFGYSGSHGCVNLPVSDAAWLYSWASVGTRVEVHD